MTNIITKERIEREYHRIKDQHQNDMLRCVAVSQKIGVPVREVIAVVADIEVTEGA